MGTSLMMNEEGKRVFFNLKDEQINSSRLNE